MMRTALPAIVVALLIAGASRAEDGDRERVARALDALSADRSAKVRAQATLALRDDAGDEAVRDALVAALDDDSPIVRAAAANVLGGLAGPHAFEALCRASRDPDPLVAKWAGWAVRRTLALARRVKVRIKGLKNPGQEKSDELTKAYQEGVLKALLEDGRFEVQSSMDFTDELEPRERVVFFGLELPGVPVPPIAVELVGRVVTTGTRKAATAAATLRVEVAGGFAAWEHAAQAEGVEGPPPPPDPYADEYSIPKEPDDARVVAAEAAGRRIGELLLASLRPEAVAPVDERRGRAGTSRRPGG